MSVFSELKNQEQKAKAQSQDQLLTLLYLGEHLDGKNAKKFSKLINEAQWTVAKVEELARTIEQWRKGPQLVAEHEQALQKYREKDKAHLETCKESQEAFKKNQERCTEAKLAAAASRDNQYRLQRLIKEHKQWKLANADTIAKLEQKKTELEGGQNGKPE